MSTPTLSLCLATYNRARYLDRYLDHHVGAFDAAGIDYEIVISDNASTDETPAILARHAAANPRIRVSRQPVNVGAYPNILTTLHRAKGEVVVSIADDDLAVPGPLLAYVRRLIEDPALVMVQAPWLQVDETKDGAILGQFYTLEGETRFRVGDYAACLGFLIQHHVLPECWLMRRSAMPAIAGANPRFAYGFVWMLAHALGKGEVLFCPEPHIAATAVSAGGDGHVGNAEAMESWDAYRGGLEVLASFARQTNPAGFVDAGQVASAVNVFVCERMAVAARLQAQAGNWSNAYQLLRRLHAYDVTPQIGFVRSDVAVLGAIETAVLECSQLGAAVAVMAEAVPDNVLERIRPPGGLRIVRPADLEAGDGRRAYCVVGDAQPAGMREGDFAYDLTATMERFPRFAD